MNNDEKAISAAQCKAGRALLDWTREDLARYSKVSRAAIADFETAKREVRARTVADLQSAFEFFGLTFIFDREEPGGGAGVRYAMADWSLTKWAEFVEMMHEHKQSQASKRDGGE